MRPRTRQDIKPIRIERPSIAELPSVHAITRLAEIHEWLILQVPTTVEVREDGERVDATTEAREGYIRDLTPHVTTHKVWDSGFLPDEQSLPLARQRLAGSHLTGMTRISLRRVVAEQALEDHFAGFVAAAVEYRILANALIRRLADQLEVDVDEFATKNSWRPHEKFGILRRQRDRGEIGDSWHYAFHGYHCAFSSRSTGVRVEARLGMGDFGVFDPMFYMEFIASQIPQRPDFAPLAEVLRDWWENAYRALDFLERRGLLRRLPSGGWILIQGPQL